MFTHRILAAVTTALGAAAIALTVATAGIASANGVDDTYVAQMKGVGVNFPPDKAGQAGHAICNALSAGATGAQLTKAMAGQGFTEKQSKAMVRFAAQDYCPQFSNQARA
ncbi:DUF732 domain-containing protein [Mycobacterium sp.]|uniref:DUF732 domain-containing protein n=1 Tax=Mycobacterium sp. TaxID=1785 RepID=UPI002C0FA90F|nr:DUF732 domain-containing protein [Mycobacterium sp.]HTQ20778.1 DUF732 domain-containing protein [Mycobacterium sp.]